MPMCVGVDEGELVNVDECPWEQKEFQKCDGRPIVRLSIGFYCSAAQCPRAKGKLINSVMITDTAHISRAPKRTGNCHCTTASTVDSPMQLPAVQGDQWSMNLTSPYTDRYRLRTSQNQ